MKKWLDRYDKGGSVKKLKPSEIADIKKFIANNADTEDINDPRYYTGKPVVNKAYNVTNRLSAGNLPRYVDPNVKNDPALKWVNAASMLGPIGVIAAPEIAAGAAALSPYLSAPLVVGGSELAAVTPASIAGAYFAHEGYKKLPQTKASVLNAYNNPTRQNILNAANDIGWNTMDFLGTGEAIRGATQLAEPIINKAGKTVVNKLSRLPFNNVPLLNQASRFNPWAFKTKPSVQELIPDVTYGTDELGSFRRVGNRKEYILSDYSQSSRYEPTLTEPAYNSYMDLLNSHNGMIPSKKEEAFFRGLSVDRRNLAQDWDLAHSLNNNENYGQYLSRGRFTHQRYNAPSSFEELYNAQPSKPQKVIKKYLNDLDKKFGSFIPVKKAASYNSQELEDLINEKLRNGMGIKKINDPVQVKLLNHGNNLNRLDFQTIINNQYTGNIGLNRNVDPYIPGRMSFTDRIFPNRNGVNAWVNSEGFRKAGDFPFNSTTRASELYHSGMSGEINSAINEALKEKGLGNILSGGTGHTDMGKGRWQNLVNKGVAEDFGFDPRTNQNYYKLKKEGGESNGWLDRYDNGGQAPARDNTTVYRNVLPISMPQPKPAYINPTPSYKDSEWYKQESEDFKTRRNITQPILHAADVATDIMQFGNFIPLPQAQAIARTGNILGSLVDAYQAADAIANKDYVSGAMNATAALLPLYMRRNEFARDMYNTKPGSLADKIASYGNRDGSYLPLSGVRTNLIKNPVMRKAVDNNKKTFGALLTETGYDSYENGGDTTDYNFLAWQLADPIRASYHVVNPKDFHGPDQYKYPNHMTFSDESMYSTPEHMGGHWTELKNGKWQFEPSQWNIQNAGGKEKFLKWWNEGEAKEGNKVKFDYGGSFSSAFAQARKELGAGKVFSWNGKQYTTNFAEEDNTVSSDVPVKRYTAPVRQPELIDNNAEMANIADQRMQYYNQQKKKVVPIPYPVPVKSETVPVKKVNSPITANKDNVKLDWSNISLAPGLPYKKTDNEESNSFNARLFINGIKRNISKLFGDDESSATKLDLSKAKANVTNKTTLGNKPIVPAEFENTYNLPRITGDTLWDDKNAGVYHMPMIVDLNQQSFGHRSRNDRTDVKSPGYLFGAIDDSRNFRHFVNAKTSQLDPDQFYSGVDPNTNKIRIQKGKWFQGKNIDVLQHQGFENVVGLAKDKKNKFVLKSAHGAANSYWTPQYIHSDNTVYGSPGLLMHKHQKDAGYYGNITGGNVILTTPDFKRQIYVSGSVNDINNAIEQFKKTTGSKVINAVTVDNGSYARNYLKANNHISAKDWYNLDQRNTSGGLGYYMLPGKKDGGQIHNWREVEVPHTKNQLSGWLDKL